MWKVQYDNVNIRMNKDVSIKLRVITMRAVIRSSIRQAIITIIVVEGSSLVIVNLLMMNRIRGEICCNH